MRLVFSRCGLCLLLALSLAACGDPSEKLHGEWKCDVNETNKINKSGTNADPLEAKVAARMVELTCSMLSLTIDTKAKTVGDSAYEPAKSGDEILLKFQDGKVMRFKTLDSETIVLVNPGASPSFVLKRH